MIDIFVDTSILWAGQSFNEKAFRQLRDMQRNESRVRIRVPEVVVMELERHAREMEAKFARDLRNINSCRELTGIDLVKFSAQGARWGSLIRAMVAEFGIVDPMPSVSHGEMARRDLARLQPFKANGSGYRDALIWESVLEFGESSRVALLTQNTNDFGRPEKLPDGLSADLHGRPQVQIIDSLRSLASWLIDPSNATDPSGLGADLDLPVEESELLAVVEDIANYETARNVRFGRRLMEDAEIEYVSASQILEATDLDSDESHGYLDVKFGIDAEVRADISRGDLSRVSEDVHIEGVAAGDESAEVRAFRSLVLEVHFSYRLDTREIVESEVIDCSFKSVEW